MAQHGREIRELHRRLICTEITTTLGGSITVAPFVGDRELEAKLSELLLPLRDTVEDLARRLRCSDFKASSTNAWFYCEGIPFDDYEALFDFVSAQVFEACRLAIGQRDARDVKVVETTDSANSYRSGLVTNTTPVGSSSGAGYSEFEVTT